MRHRSDIDGLRALAIIPVILFHYHTRGFRGGFLGVDVFFVISGFLITTIIHREISEKSFSFQKFYERRIRRIFPAAFAVMVTLLFIGFFVFLPREFQDLSNSAIATTLFVSNFYFFKSDNYFGPISQHEPLLHTWSLAVEEQFYFAFPIVLISLRRLGSRATLVLIFVLALASLGLDTWLSRVNSSAAFFLPLPRAWELLTGSILALLPGFAVKNATIRNFCGFSGLALILYSMVLVPTNAYPFVPLAIFPCLGSALLLTAGTANGSIVSSWLGIRPLTYVGKISYSLYVWHWPILIIYYLLLPPTSHFSSAIIPIILTCAVAALSERYIERPFRVPRSISPPTIFKLATAAMAITIVVSYGIERADGFPSRFPATVDGFASYVRYDAPPDFRSGSCFIEPQKTNDSVKHFSPSCLRQDVRRSNVLLLGDSHAAQLWVGLSHEYPGTNFMQATVAGCKPMARDTSAYTLPADNVCRDLMDYMYRQYIPTHKIDGVIICARWENGDAQELDSTVRLIKRYEPYVSVIGPIVEYSEALPRLLAISALRNDPGLVESYLVKSIAPLDGSLELALEATGVHYISIYRTICAAGQCQTTTRSGVPLQFDYGHLTTEGSIWVAERWKRDGLLFSRGRARAEISRRKIEHQSVPQRYSLSTKKYIG